MQVTSTNSAQAGAQAGTQAVSGSNLGTKDTFLKLLVAQMQNQDPMKPQDPTQMTAQLAQFNMVEQQLNSNKLLTNISTSLQSANKQGSNAASYLGHKAVVNSSTLNYDGSTPQSIVVQSNQSAAKATVQVLDANGNVVKTLNSGTMGSGSHAFTWNGTTDSGSTAPAGAYSIAVKAVDAGGQSITTNTQLVGQVQAINLSTNGTQLVVNGTPVSMAKIQQILL